MVFLYWLIILTLLKFLGGFITSIIDGIILLPTSIFLHDFINWITSDLPYAIGEIVIYDLFSDVISTLHVFILSLIIIYLINRYLKK